MLAGVLCGATAAGKSALALRIAEANGFEIISADSRQIYRGLSVGVNAPTEAERARVRHHLVGFLDPSESFSPREFPARVHAILEAHPGKGFLVAGGSGLYLKALLYPSARDRGPTPESVREEVKRRLEEKGAEALLAELKEIDPEGARGLHKNDAYRIAKRWENVLITGEGYGGYAGAAELDPRFADTPVLWIDVDRELLYRRIDARAEAMARAGWPEEARALAARPGWGDLPGATSLGYREMAAVGEGSVPLEKALAEIRKRTRNYAKRQITFFRRQLPAAERWEEADLVKALEACAWDWEAFRRRRGELGRLATPHGSRASGGSNP
jgi:tRNA dimethylallyltransferase